MPKLNCAVNKQGNTFCSTRKNPSRPNTSYDASKKKAKQKKAPMDTPALRRAYQKEAQKKKRAEAKADLTAIGKKNIK